MAEAMWLKPDVMEGLIDQKQTSLSPEERLSLELVLDVLARQPTLFGLYFYRSLAQSQWRL